MKKFCEWWRTAKGHTMEPRYVTLIKSLLLGILPLICCLVYCGVEGRTLGEVYPPCSEWNDELFYYKQVEGIINYGYPQGYFGFNESHALKLSFAAWSPVLVFPWILWGLVFGWNLMSPMLCNIALMTLCCVSFVWLVRLTWKQLGILALLFCLYTPFVRYMLSVMPEVICFVMVILFYGLAVNTLRREKGYKLALLFLMSGLMTLMRPYLLLFMLFPAWLWSRRSGWKGAAGSLAVIGAAVGLYACIKHYLGAEYFAPLFFTDWIHAFFERGLFGGLRYTIGKLYYMGKDFLGHTLQGLRTGLASGAFFGGFLVCTGVLAGQSAADLYRIRRDRKRGAGAAPGERTEDSLVPVEIHLAFSCIAMLFALLLMYKLTEGSKHLLTFMAASVFVISLMKTRFYKKAVLVGAVFAYFYSYMAVNPYDYQVPFAQEERMAQLEQWQGIFEDKLFLEEGAPSYENVVIWVFGDTVDGASVCTAWQQLYVLPEGFGISCCMPGYVKENIDDIKSRYLFVAAGGEIDALCARAGYEKVAEGGGSVLYRCDAP